MLLTSVLTSVYKGSKIKQTHVDQHSTFDEIYLLFSTGNGLPPISELESKPRPRMPSTPGAAVLPMLTLASPNVWD